MKALTLPWRLLTFARMSFYAVARGRLPGIYKTWSKCEEQVKHYKGAKYKKFKTLQQAQEYINASSGESIIVQHPRDEAVALGKRDFVGWKSSEPPAKKAALGREYWPESDDNSLDESFIKEILLSAAAATDDHVNVDSKDSKSTNLSTAGNKADKYCDSNNFKDIAGFQFNVDAEDFVIAYTDGSCINNGTKKAVAGFGVFFADNHPLNTAKPVIGRVTNNAGEIQASIHAIKVAKDLNIAKLCIRTDSQFLIKAVTCWMDAWKKKNWCLASGGAVKNQDDFKKLNKLLSDGSVNVKWEYVPAHCGIKGNEMADQLARDGAEIYRTLHAK